MFTSLIVQTCGKARPNTHLGKLSMIKFNSLSSQGIEVRKVKGKYGETIVAYWQWPWSRAGGYPYLCRVTNDAGGVFMEISGTHPDSLVEEAVRKQYGHEGFREVSGVDGVSAVSFNLGNLLRDFFSQSLPDGEYLVFIPKSRAEEIEFWNKRGVSTVERGCMLLDVTHYQGHILEMVDLQKVLYGGRYFQIRVEKGYTLPVKEFQ